ncbi:MAG: winged helix-turn-helix transcriptional regulator [Parvularculaceae bacterium]
MARTYNQDCVLAYALDLLGERWTLLIVRELFLGPRRFGDLQASLPGIGANLLSKRLKELAEAGLIVAPGADETRGNYRLAPQGDALRPTIRALMCWSIDYFIDRPESAPARESIYTNNLQPDSVALAMELFANYREAAALNYVVHALIDGHPYTFYYMNGEMIARRGVDTPAVAHIETDVATVMQAMRKEISASEARAHMKSNGDAAVLAHFIDSFALQAWVDGGSAGAGEKFAAEA